ncbi:MAG: class I SAM-dependent methyltransferase [Verrucomicrobiota bacterium]
MISYEEQTVASGNPIARFAHRNRLKRSLRLASDQLPQDGHLLDYGCGDGRFVKNISLLGFNAVGYEPFMEEHLEGVQVVRSYEEIVDLGVAFDLITVFETLEHLEDQEIVELLERAKGIISPSGKILFSVPIEIGPAVILKTLNREWRCGKPGFNTITPSLLKAACFGIPESRAEDVKSSHQGFDFRKSIRFLENNGCTVNVIAYGPIPGGFWYGNSQVYFTAQLAKNDD